MKKFLTILLVLMIAVAFALAITACKDEEEDDPPVEVQRVFTINGFAKPITIKDMRTGSHDTDLATLGVIARLETGLQAQTGNPFETVINRVLTIEVEETTAYNRFQARSGNRLGVNFTYISTDDEYLSDRLDGQIVTMSEMDTLG